MIRWWWWPSVAYCRWYWCLGSLREFNIVKTQFDISYLKVEKQVWLIFSNTSNQHNDDNGDDDGNDSADENDNDDNDNDNEDLYGRR